MMNVTDYTNIKTLLIKFKEKSDVLYAKAAALSNYATIEWVGTQIPSVGNGTVIIKQNGTSKGSFTMNQSGGATINLTDTTYSSLSAVSGGTDKSLVTTGEKYAWNSKQAAISDLATIRSNATTAFGWGDHSEAGYITGITKDMVESVLTGNITSHTHSYIPLADKGLSGGKVPYYVIFPSYDTLVSLGYNEASTVTEDEYYFKGLCKWAIDNFSNQGYLILTGNAQPNSIGYCRIELYSNHGKDANTGLPRYCSGTYLSLNNVTTNFVCRNYMWSWGGTFNGDASTASKWTNARTITLTGSVTGSVSLDGSGNVSLDTTTNHTHTFASLTSKPTTLSGYGITDALSLTGGTLNGWLIINASSLPISELTTDGNTSNNTWNSAQNVNLLLRSANNAMTISLGGQENERKGIIQVGHSASSYANFLGDLYLNKFGGNVYIGENLAYHAGNCNLPTIPWTCSSLTAINDVTAKAGLYGQFLEFTSIGSSAGHGGFIDFHFNGNTADYTSRIIEDAAGQLTLRAGTINIGTAAKCFLYLQRPSVNYIWANTKGGEICIGTADGGETSELNSGINIIGKRVYIGGTVTGSNALNVAGVAHATTGIYTDGYISARRQDTASDIKLKKDFRKIDNALKYVLNTHYTRFRWKDDNKESIGIIAQEEQNREYGFLVQNRKEIGHLTYDYAASTALLGAAIQEEDSKVEKLRKRIIKLENELSNLKKKWQH